MRCQIVVLLLAVGIAHTLPQRCLQAANLVFNGGFEEIQAFPQPFVDWTVIEGFTAYLFPVTIPHTGTWAAGFAATHHADDTLLQSISTTPGVEYVFEFWLTNPDYGEPPDNDFTVLWNGAPVLALVNGPYFAHTHYSFTLVANATQTELRFVGVNAPGGFALDDVSVMLVPEPSSIALAAVALVGLLALSRRKRR